MTFFAAGARCALSARLGRGKASQVVALALAIAASRAPIGLVQVLQAASGPIINLHLDEGAGTTASDASGNGNTGALLNGPTWTTGTSAGALNFDGVNDTLYIANTASLNTVTTGVTVAAWVYRPANQSGGVSVVSREVGNTYYEHYYLGFENGKYRWFVNTSSGYSDTTIGSQAPVGQWLHLVGTYDGATVKLYVNGVLQFSTPHSGTFATDTTGLTIGASHNDASHAPVEAFGGKVDEVDLYAQPLTQAEVLTLYQATGGTIDNPPSVALTAPASGATVQGTFTATASAADDLGVAGVQFQVDGLNAGAEDAAAPFSTAIQTWRYSEGAHVVTAVARDTSGHVTVSNSASVVFDNVAIMPLGDSYTYGYVSDNNPGNEDGGYRRYLWEKLLANGVTNVNFVGLLANGIATMDRDHEGHNGWRIDEVDAQVSGWLASTQPDVILLLLGSNDIIQGGTPALALSRMSTLLDRIHSLRPSAKLIVSTLPGTRANADSIFVNLSPQNATVFNNGLASQVSTRVGQGWNLSLVDVYNGAGLDRSSGSPDFSSDGLHLSALGYSKFANLWYAAISPGPADTQAPSVPTGLAAVSVSSSQISLTWSASTDNVGVTGYQVIRNGTLIGTTTATSYQSVGLAAGTTYTYKVTAFDAAGNQSGQSAAASATTGTSSALGPIVHLALNEGSGTTAADSSGLGNNAVAQNGPTWVAGRSGTALNFDGVNDTLYIPYSATVGSPTTGLTVAAWVYRNANQAGGVSVASRELGSTYYEHFYLGFENGNYRWFVNTTNGYSNTALGGAAPVGQWIHLVGTYDGSSAKLYVNGMAQFSTAASGTFYADATGVTIGASHNDAGHAPTEGFSGAIDEVNLYSYALSASEVQQLYQATGSSDATLPSATLTAPANRSTVSGASVVVSATASDNVAVAGVQFLLDGSLLGAEILRRRPP